jgi:hypothetical protein
MTKLGESVFKAVNFLTDFFKDVSKLVTTIEDNMTSNKLVSLWGGTGFWFYSRAYYAPTKWIPRYVVRQYVAEAPDDSKPNQKAPWFAFFNVYFTPKEIQEPVAVWGIGTQTEEEDLWKCFDRVLLDQNGPDFLTAVPIESWKELVPPPKPLSSFKYQAMLAVELSSAQTVDKVVIQPLLAEVEELRERV